MWLKQLECRWRRTQEHAECLLIILVFHPLHIFENKVLLFWKFIMCLTSCPPHLLCAGRSADLFPLILQHVWWHCDGCLVSGQLGWVLVLRLRPVSVFHPNVRLARPKGDLQLRLLEQYSRTSVTRDQGEKHQRKPQHFCSTSKGSRAGCLPVRRLLLWLSVSAGGRERRIKGPCDGFWWWLFLILSCSVSGH